MRPSTAVLISAVATAAAADGTIRPYGTAKAAPRPLRTSDGATTPRAAEAWTPRPVQDERRLSHGAPHCVQDGAFVEDACDLCYGGCDACWEPIAANNCSGAGKCGDSSAPNHSRKASIRRSRTCCVTTT